MTISNNAYKTTVYMQDINRRSLITVHKNIMVSFSTHLVPPH